MAEEKAGGNSPANSGGDNPNKGSRRSNRRRSSRNRRRGRKPEENSTNAAPRTEGRSESRSENRSESRTGSRTENRSEPRGESRSSRSRQNSAKGGDKTTRDNRERRRRRRMRSKQRGQSETTSVVVGDTLKDLPPLVPAFVYTHVSRPAMRDGFEFRTEHFSKVTRKLDDFHIDLSPLYPDGGDEIKGVAYMPPLSEADRAKTDDRVFDDGGYDDEDDEEYEEYEAASERPANRTRVVRKDSDAAVDEVDEIIEDEDWDAEESDDAARLDGATRIDGVIADEFNAELDDSVVDEYPEEDLDA